MSQTFHLNTSNPGKLAEFKRLFSQEGISLLVSERDLREADADPLTVITQKASQLPDRTLVEDTSLLIEGEGDEGVNIRWLMDRLAQWKGKKARWLVLLAYKEEETVKIFRGEVSGTITTPQGKGGFGFDPYFLPDGTDQTLSEAKPDSVNARAYAVKNLAQASVWSCQPVITNWPGPWQSSS